MKVEASFIVRKFLNPIAVGNQKFSDQRSLFTKDKKDYSLSEINEVVSHFSNYTVT
ncbi:MAG: hypothetical protein V7K55_19690 [Nostoc sp.]|uniref:hypothetical protein n=1 Tax=Nostoc sp. TaxID=1180 RepID=UPI002FFA4750